MVMFGKIVPVHGEAIDDWCALSAAGPDISRAQARRRGARQCFEGAPRIETGGVIYPGLLDLHQSPCLQHPAALDSSKVCSASQWWLKLAEYRRSSATPMSVLTERRPDLIQGDRAIRRDQAFLWRRTSGQGMNSTFGGVPYFQGIVRNFEVPADRELPSATTGSRPQIRYGDREIPPESGVRQAFFFHLA